MQVQVSKENCCLSKTKCKFFEKKKKKYWKYVKLLTLLNKTHTFWQLEINFKQNLNPNNQINSELIKESDTPSSFLYDYGKVVVLNPSKSAYQK